MRYFIACVIGSLCVLAGRSEYAPTTYMPSVSELYGQIRLEFNNSPSVASYNVYSYVNTKGELDSSQNTTGPALIGNTRRDYYIVQPGSYQNGYSYSYFNFAVTPADENGVTLAEPPSKSRRMPKFRAKAVWDSRYENRPSVKYRLKASSTSISCGGVCDVVMQKEYSNHRQVWMEVWDEAVVWKITSGAEYASFVRDENLLSDYLGGKLVDYSMRYGVRILANANITSEKKIKIEGTLVGSSGADAVETLTITVKPKVRVSFVSKGNAELSEVERLYKEGDSYGVLPTATRSGYDFAGWYTSGGARVEETTIVSKEITELYAKWLVKTPWNDGVYVDVVDTEGMLAASDDDATFRFRITDGLATLISAESDNLPTNLVIPDKLGGCPVVTIDYCAFYDRDELVKVTIPESVKRIEREAFYGCSNLNDVIFRGDKDHIEFDSTTFLDTPYESVFFALVIGDDVVVDYLGNVPERLVIPDGVMSIAESVFESYEYWDDELGDWVLEGGTANLKEVVIPASMETIGAYAFYGCKNLEKVTFAGNPLEVAIGTSAFYGTKANSKIFKIVWATDSSTGAKGVAGFSGQLPEDIVLPEGVEAIFGWSFYSMNGVKSVTIPASVNTISDSAFLICSDLVTVRFLGRPPRYLNGNSGVLDYASKVYYPHEYEDEWSKLVPAEKFAGYVEPQGEYSVVCFDIGDAERVGGGALVQSVKMHGSAVAPVVQPRVGLKLKGWDGEFTSVTSNMVIRAIYEEKDLSEPYEDGEYTTTVDNCTWKFKIENGLAEIIVNWSATWPSHVQIPERLGNCPVVSIGNQVFAWQSTILTITIPKSVALVEPSAFQNCSCLESIDVEDGNANFKSIDGILSNKAGSKLVCCPAGRVDVVVANDVSVIGADAFCYCSNLKSVVLPNGVVEIGEGAFAYCRSLSDVTFKGDLPADIGYDAFAPEPFQSASNVLIVRYPEGNATWNPLPSTEYWYGAENVMYVPWSNSTIHVPASQTGGVELNVESEWFEQYPAFEAKFGSDKGVGMLAKTGKIAADGHEMAVWEDYITGTDPTNPNDIFKASITFDSVTAEPVISWTPELPADRAALRKYTTYGKEKLSDKDWTVVTDNAAGFNFFRVTVEMK